MISARDSEEYHLRASIGTAHALFFLEDFSEILEFGIIE
jgi:hypothetical protein